MALTMYHNPRCSKSRETLALLEEEGYSPAIRRYYDTPMHRAELCELVQQLGFESPRELMRTKEKIYKDLDIKDIDDDERLLAAMLAHPQLIERPIVTDGERAVLGRPPENVRCFFKK